MKATSEERLARVTPEGLDEAQRALYDAIAGGRRAAGGSPFPLTGPDGALNGPFNAMLLQPALGTALQALGGAVRYETALSDRARELAILVVARAQNSAFERSAHEAVGRAAGLSEDELRTLYSDDPAERLVVDTAAALAEHEDLTDAEFARARDGLGLPAVFELTTLVGYYATLALQLRVFRAEPETP
ncbi:carboxymuconolactone decarboxylase family protein [Dactylosporangium darangshiense]|uniref:Carboxymuconolactone decarboxylase-like domain-containing protein n=1 Tax=Dactylosporangium darangshiense TaxID=579108 RepID=A0ABP8CZD3_9ACTN